MTSNDSSAFVSDKKSPAATRSDLAAPSPKELRDTLFAWLYITAGQASNIASSPLPLATITSQIVTALTPHITMTPAMGSKISTLVANVKTYGPLFGSVAMELNSFGPDNWSGQTDHPTPGELDGVFAQL